jgi:hypothetical protein
MRGKFKGREGKVTAVYRKKFVIHVERISMDKSNGAFARARAWPPAPRGAANPPPSPPSFRRDGQCRHSPEQREDHEAHAHGP